MGFIQRLVGFFWVILLPLVPTIVISNALSSEKWSKLLSSISLPQGTIQGITVTGPFAAYIAFLLVANSVYYSLSKLQSDVSKIVNYRLEDAQKIVGKWNYKETIRQEINSQPVIETYTGMFELWFDRDGKLLARGKAFEPNGDLSYKWDTDRIFVENGRITALYTVINQRDPLGRLNWDGRLTLDWDGNSSEKITAMHGDFDTFGLLRRGTLTITR